MKVTVLEDLRHGNFILAKSYNLAVNYLFGSCYISENEEIMIDGQYTTLKEYFGEDVVDMMACEWNEIDFNEFWNGDFYIHEQEVIDC